jgi:hypothetical protein
MIRNIVATLLILLIPVCSFALDKKIGSTNQFKIGIFDTSSKGNGITGLTYNTDYIVKVQCGSGSIIPITGDTVTAEGGGYYRITTNSSITPTNEDECLVWSEGAGNYVNLIAKTPVKFKAVGATIDTGILITSGTEGAGVSTTTLIYTSLSNNTRRYMNMCLETSTGERSRITGYGSGTFTVRGFAVAPTDGSTLKIYEGGCI